jgi:hypothetical protein
LAVGAKNHDGGAIVLDAEREQVAVSALADRQIDYVDEGGPRAAPELYASHASISNSVTVDMDFGGVRKRAIGRHSVSVSANCFVSETHATRDTRRRRR